MKENDIQLCWVSFEFWKIGFEFDSNGNKNPSSQKLSIETSIVSPKIKKYIIYKLDIENKMEWSKELCCEV